MCFSAAASFTAAGMLLLIGLCSIALVLCTSKEDVPMTPSQKLSLALVAAIPLIFGVHQALEGVVWLDPENAVAVRFFAYTAYVFWPFYISLSFTMIEWTRSIPQGEGGERCGCCTLPCWLLPQPARKWLLVFNTVVASALLVVAVISLQKQEPLMAAESENGRLEYTSWGLDDEFAILGFAAYLFIVVASLSLSSLKYSTLFAAAVLLALIPTLYLWLDQFPSTWCFFAAILSTIVFVIVRSELQVQRREAQQLQNGRDRGVEMAERP